MKVTVHYHNSSNGVSFDTIYYGITSIKELKKDTANQVGENEYEHVYYSEYHLMKDEINVAKFIPEDYKSIDIEFEKTTVDEGF